MVYLTRYPGAKHAGDKETYPKAKVCQARDTNAEVIPLDKQV